MMQHVQDAVAALNATNTDILGITIKGSRPVIRVSRSAWCMRLIEEGKAGYVHTGRDNQGVFRQGVFELHGCRVVWPESLW
ncbi:hypothetical protein BvCmsNSNP012_01898 [Escherichia coli]|nr:hypothetical protein [Escherichia coli]GDO99228.1 hypothetical protein BvCmsNSNP012_01898 [Escherichia coli]